MMAALCIVSAFPMDAQDPKQSNAEGVTVEVRDLYEQSSSQSSTNAPPSNSEPLPTPAPAAGEPAQQEVLPPLPLDIESQDQPESPQASDAPEHSKPQKRNPPAKSKPEESVSRKVAPRLTNEELDAAGEHSTRRPLTQKDVLRKALENNLDIKIKELASGIEGDRLRSARGIFDPVLGFDGRWERIDHPQTVQEFTATGGSLADLNLLGGNPRNFEEENWRWKTTLDGRTPIGTKWQLFDQWDILHNTLNRTSPLSLFSPEYATFAGITVTQPLLRDFGSDVNLTEIRVARKNQFISELELQAQIQSTVAEVLQDFYDLAYSDADTRLRREELALARRLVEDKRNQLERGLVSPRDYAKAESVMADSVERLVQSELRRADKQSALDRLIERDYDPREMGEVRPFADLRDEKPTFDRDKLMGIAVQNRPDYLIAHEKVDREQIKLIYAENQIWPRIDFKSTAGVNGLDRGWYRSWKRSTDPQGTQYSMGVTMSFPIGNQEAIGKKNEAEKTREQALALLQEAELTTVLDIKKAIEVLDANYRRLEAMRTMRRNVENAFEDEKVRLEKGLSTEVDVLKFHRDVTEAKTRELLALTEFNKAIIAMYMATGTLLNDQQIVLEK